MPSYNQINHLIIYFVLTVFVIVIESHEKTKTNNVLIRSCDLPLLSVATSHNPFVLNGAEIFKNGSQV